MCYLVTISIGARGDLSHMVKIAREVEVPLVVVRDHPSQSQFDQGVVLLQAAWHCDCGSAIGAREFSNSEQVRELEDWRKILLSAYGDWVGIFKCWSSRQSRQLKVRQLPSREQLSIEELLMLPNGTVLKLPPDG